MKRRKRRLDLRLSKIIEWMSSLTWSSGERQLDLLQLFFAHGNNVIAQIRRKSFWEAMDFDVVKDTADNVLIFSEESIDGSVVVNEAPHESILSKGYYRRHIHVDDLTSW